MTRNFPICYETHGDPNDPCIILITGIGGQLIQWSKLFIDELARNDFYVVTFDNRDSGLSQYYDHLGTFNLSDAIHAKQTGKEFKPPYTFNDMADDILLLMNKLSHKKAHILGSSMGGMIAQSFALKYPDNILSLILIATSSGDLHLPPAKPEVIQLISSTLPNDKVDLTSYVDSKTRLFQIYDPYFFNEENTRMLFDKMYNRTTSFDGFNRQLLALISEQPRGDRLKNVSINSLIVHGSHDPAFSIEHGKYLHNVLPNSRLEIIEKMGHLISEELCERISHLVTAFIQDTITDKTINKSSIGMGKS